MQDSIVPWFHSWVRKTCHRREWRPTLVFWPREFHGLYRPWGSQRVTHSWVTFTFPFIKNCFSIIQSNIWLGVGMSVHFKEKEVGSLKYLVTLFFPIEQETVSSQKKAWQELNLGLWGLPWPAQMKTDWTRGKPTLVITGFSTSCKMLTKKQTTSNLNYYLNNYLNYVTKTPTEPNSLLKCTGTK